MRIPSASTLAALTVAAFVSLTMVSLPLAAADDRTLPEHLSMDDALRIFRARGFDLLIADAVVMSAEGDEKVAGAIANPSWALQGSYTFTLHNPSLKAGQPDPGTLETPWGVYAELGDSNAIADAISGKRGLRIKVARAALAAAKLSRADAQRNLEFQVKSQYMAALLARDLLDFAIEIQKVTQTTYDLAHVRYQAGAISEADEAKTETAKLEAEQTVESAGQALHVAKLGLAYLLGVRGQVPEFHVAPDLPPFVVPPRLASADPVRLLDDAFEHRADLQGVERQRQRAEASLRLAKRLRFPDLGLNISYTQQAGYDAAAAQPPTLALGVTSTLPVFYLQRGEILRAEADLRTQGLQRGKLEAQVASDVQVAWTNFTSTRKLLERMQGRLLGRATRARDLVEIQYKKGAASLLELLDAQRTWIATNEEYYQDLANYWTAVFQLEQAVGMELR